MTEESNKNHSHGILSRFVGAPRNDTERDARTTGTAMAWALAIGLGFAICSQPHYWAASCMWSGACALTGMLLGFLFGIPRSVARSGVPTTNPAPSPQPGSTTADPPQQQPGQPGDPAVGAVQQQPGQGGPAADPPQQQPGQPGGPAAGAVQQQQGQDGSSASSGQQQSQQGVNTNLEEISDWLTKIIVGVSLVEAKKAQGILQQSAGFIAETLGGAGQTSFAYGLMVYFSIAGFLGSYLLTRLYLQRAFQNAASSQ
jgi:hypothetical protein